MKSLLAGVMVLTLGATSSLASAKGAPARAAASAEAPAAAQAAPAQPSPAQPAAVAVPPAAAPVAEPAPAEAPAATPLATRPTKLVTMPSSSDNGQWGYKLLAGVGVAAAAGLWLKKKRGAKNGSTVATKIDVVGRTSLGMRSELLVVDVDGTRLLVGMTPSAIQTLAILDSPGLGSVEALAEDLPARDERTAAPRSERALREERRDDRDPHDRDPRDRDPRDEDEDAAGSAPMVDVANRARALLGGSRIGGRSVAPPKRIALPKPKRMPRVAGQAKGLLLALEPEEEDRSAKKTDAKGSPVRPMRLGDW